ncbi:hypothetical protein [Arthrobacter sp. 162MFSha1.1]|uniref:hypothetical protein n=1 Tax=Arthrobacter sp. 162MFSha1.1 TaxID=1151119 RepID=UPI0003701EB2|nr:hypothetical protein [Arthrobacter sp. 162MFSha1.1]
MCKAKCKGGVRCFPHSPEARAESRASGKVWDCLTDLKVRVIAFWDGATAKAATREEAEQVLSRWHAFIQEVMLAFHKARIDRAEKRAAARELRQTLDRERNEQLEQAERERVEKGEKHWGQEVIEREKKATLDAEKAAQEVEDAEDALLDAGEDLACTLPKDFALSPYEAVRFQYAVAQVDAEDARDNYYAAKNKLKPADLKPDPKTGLPSRKQMNVMRLKRHMEATQQMEQAWNARLERTMTREQAEAARDAAAVELEAAKGRWEVAKEERHAARCAARDSSAVADLELAA